MSLEALCQAVKNHLQAQLELSDAECDLVAEGQPVPMAGQEFLGIHDGGWDGQSLDYDLDELCRVQVTLTRRIGEYPLDRLGADLIWKATSGLGPRLRRIITLLHKNYAVMNAANALIDAEAGTAQNGFVTPLWFLGASGPQFRGPEWFYGTLREVGKDVFGMYGISRTLTFGKAQRVQRVDFMT